MASEFVSDELELGRILSTLSSDEQALPTVLVTLRPFASAPDFDADALALTLGDDARVVVVAASLTRQIQHRLGDDFNVHSGAARVFPVRRRGVPYHSTLVLPDEADPDRKADWLLRSAQAAVAELQPTSRTTAVAPRPDAPRDQGQRTNDRRAGARGVQLIDTTELAAALGRHLLNPHRELPVLLATRRAGAPEASVDLRKILDEVGDRVEVYDMVTGAVSWAFADALHDFPGTECYGGASRLYPTGLDWTTKLALSPLRFVYSAAEAEQATEALIADALAASFRSGWSARPGPGARVDGKVQFVAGGRGLVSLPGGQLATIWPELTVPNVPAERLLQAGMHVTGVLDGTSRRLDVTGMAHAPGDALANYVADSLVLGRVVAIERALAVLEIFPDIQAALPPEEILADGADVDVRQWLSVDEVVIARVIRPGESDDDWELSLRGLDPDAAPLAAPAILRGGPPWLALPDRPGSSAFQPRPDETAGQDADASEGPAADPVVAEGAERPVAQPSGQQAPANRGVTERRSPAQPDPDALEELRRQLHDITIERDQFARQFEQGRRAAERRDAELRTLRTRARETQASLDKVRRQLAGSEEAVQAMEKDAAAFTDPAEQFRYEVDLAWARRIPAGEKANLVRRPYRLLPSFLPTLDEHGERDRSKAIEVVLDIITGRVHDLNARQTHRLRTGNGGDDAFVSRPDRATCWRVSLQHKTPQARRLHFWQLPDGSVELSSVRGHDDIRP